MRCKGINRSHIYILEENAEDKKFTGSAEITVQSPIVITLTTFPKSKKFDVLSRTKCMRFLILATNVYYFPI
jgi:hypothetical protein